MALMNVLGVLMIGGFVLVVMDVIKAIKEEDEKINQRDAWRSADKWNWD